MSIFEPKCLCPGAEIPDADADLRGANRVAQYRVSARAFYLPAFPGWQYIPFSALTRAIARSASLPTIGCCGKQLPVLKLVLRYEGGEEELIIDPPRHMDTILDCLRTGRADLAVEDRR